MRPQPLLPDAPTAPPAELEALYKARALEVEEFRDARNLILRFRLLRMAVVVLFAGIVLGYDRSSSLALDHAHASLRAWMEAHPEPWLRTLRYQDLVAETEQQRREVWRALSAQPLASHLSGASTLRALREELGAREALLSTALELLDSVGNDLKLSRPPSTVADLKRAAELTRASLEPGGPRPPSFARMISGLQEIIPVREEGTLSQLRSALVEAQRSFDAAAPYVGIKDPSPWDAWSLDAFRSLKDTHADEFREKVVLPISGISTQEVASLERSPTVGHYLAAAQSYLASERRRRLEELSTRSVQVWDLKIALPIDGLLAAFPSLFLLSQSLLVVLRAHARARMIRITATEKRISALLGSELNGMSIGEESLTPTRTLDYVLRRQWSLLFENDPDIFVDIFFAASTWAVATFIIGRSFLMVAPIGDGAVAPWISIVVWASTVLAMSVLIGSILVSRTVERSVRELALRHLRLHAPR